MSYFGQPFKYFLTVCILHVFCQAIIIAFEVLVLSDELNDMLVFPHFPRIIDLELFLID